MGEDEWNGQTIVMGGPGAKTFETYHAVQVSDDFADGMGEKDTNGQTIRVKGDKGMESYNTLLQLNKEDAKAAAGKLSRPAGPIRGEKQWQDWAQDFNNWSDLRTMRANTRIPYNSTLQLEDINFIHVQNQDGDELIKMEGPNDQIPINFRL